MVQFIRDHRYVVSVLILLIVIGSVLFYRQSTSDPLAGLITTTVKLGTVESLVSVSGITEASATADLAFATAGVVSKIYVEEGTIVSTGDTIATLGAEELVAARASAIADLRVAEADRLELISGDTEAIRDITNTKVAIAEAELLRIKNAESVAVNTARRSLLSSDLTARTEDAEENAGAPVVSGTYTCDQEGTYILSVYSSNSESGYSIQLSGLEAGTYIASIDQPTLIGNCGLYVKFTPDDRYSNTAWLIDIPNQITSSYTTNRNALQVAEIKAKNAIAAATQALTLAKQEQIATNASPRSEALIRADAQIAKATAQISQIEAQLGDRIIVAPFAGIITSVDIVTGETASTLPVFTLLGTDTIELTARIPEIDITSIVLNQSARVVFDAESTTKLNGAVTYISPLPIQIDGVAYFEVKISLNENPTWLRGGLNADVDIVTASTPNVLLVPKRYIITDGETAKIRTLSGTTISTTTITRIAEGNDGFVAIIGVTEGTTIVTP